MTFGIIGKFFSYPSSHQSAPGGSNEHQVVGTEIISIKLRSQEAQKTNKKYQNNLFHTLL